jgi:hypothetical protein
MRSLPHFALLLKRNSRFANSVPSKTAQSQSSQVYKKPLSSSQGTLLNNTMTETSEPLNPCHDKHAAATRYCTACQCNMPLQMFRPGSRKSKCTEHLREAQRRYVLGTTEKRAFNALRCKARADMPLFQQTCMPLKRSDVIKMLTAAQIENFSRFCLVPLRPDLPLTAANSAVVSSPERKYIVGNYRYSRDAQEYQRDLRHVLLMRIQADCKSAPESSPARSESCVS